MGAAVTGAVTEGDADDSARGRQGSSADGDGSGDRNGDGTEDSEETDEKSSSTTTIGAVLETGGDSASLRVCALVRGAREEMGAVLRDSFDHDSCPEARGHETLAICGWSRHRGTVGSSLKKNGSLLPDYRMFRTAETKLERAVLRRKRLSTVCS